MKILSFFLLITLSLSLPSCIAKDESGRRFQGDRRKTETRTRDRPNKDSNPTVVDAEQTATPTTEPNSKSESLLFPVNITSQHSKVTVQSSDNTKMTVFAEPKDIAISLRAGWSGSVSLSTSGGTHNFVLTSSITGQTLHFELKEEGTNVFLTNGQISQGHILASTINPIVFYVQKEGRTTVLCLSLDDLAQKVTVDKKFTPHPDCP